MLVLTVALIMTAMLVVMAGPALAAPGNNGKAGVRASPNASSSITNAIVKSGSDCQIACEKL